MEKKTEQVLKSLKGKRVGAFWDDSNIFHAYQNYGWKISIEKSKNLLEKYCDLQFFNYYIVIPRKSDSAYRETMKLLEAIKPFVSVKKKNLKYIQKGEGVVEDKGKEIIFVGYKENMAWELRLCKHIFVNRIKEKIAL